MSPAEPAPGPSGLPGLARLDRLDRLDRSGVPSLPSLSDEALFARYQGGDFPAFKELFVRYGRLVQQLLFALLENATTAQVEEAASRGWLALHQHRAELRPGEPLRPFLLGHVARLRRELSRGPAVSAAAGAAPVSAPAQLPLWSLPETYREVVVLHGVCGLGFAEIATALGATPESVKVRAEQGYAQLLPPSPEAPADAQPLPTLPIALLPPEPAAASLRKVAAVVLDPVATDLAPRPPTLRLVVACAFLLAFVAGLAALLHRM